MAGLTRRDRRPCNYEIYLPDPLAGRNFSLDGNVAADISEAEAALARLNTSGSALAGAEALAPYFSAPSPSPPRALKASSSADAGCSVPMRPVKWAKTPMT